MSEQRDGEEIHHGDTEARKGRPWGVVFRIGEKTFQWGRHSCLLGEAALTKSMEGFRGRLVGETDRSVCLTVQRASRLPASPCLRASVVSLLLLGLIVGCSPTQPTTSPAPAMTHEEEHGILPHKPHNFAKAVSEVQRRGRELLNSGTRSDAALSEWFDIIGWLPELAGDTELKRADWDKVARVTTQLESWSAAWRDPTGNNALPTVDQLEPLLSELQSTLSQLPPGQRSITPRSHPQSHTESEGHSRD